MVINELIKIIGSKNVLTKDIQTRRFCKGFRFGSGKVLAVALPKNLVEQWRVLKLCVENNLIVIMQAANTGLTGGSTPFGDDYDRPVVLISTERMGGIQLIDDGKQVVCLPGSTLNQLEQVLAPLGREPHSVLGSSCVGASVLGGVCNNSGGALVRRGPVYTELALYARVNENGKLELINHLGINLGDDPETILSNLEQSNYSTDDIVYPVDRVAANHTYCNEVKKVDANTPARFNANPEMLFEASGSAGKLSLFAVRLDTFVKEKSKVIYIATNDPDDLTNIRRYLLTELPDLPIAAEYFDKTAFGIGEKYGKDTFLFIRKFGTDKVAKVLALKNKIDSIFEKINLANLSDKVIQTITALLPRHLPEFMYEYHKKYNHHLLLRVSDNSFAIAQSYLVDYFTDKTTGEYKVCSDSEGSQAFLHRFAIAGAAVRYRETHKREVEDVVALDVALRRNDNHWVESLPVKLKEQTRCVLYYGHFFCHVFHQDYIVKKGVKPLDFEHRLWDLLDTRGAEYPAEHNVGHLYHAKPALADFYKSLDPTNSFNPGIGNTSKKANFSSN